ncbi:TIGR00266 family protein [bacterium]|nr:MAG: TIGR00266 family protein [bacterium]
MRTKLLYPGTNSMIEFELERGEAIKAESGAMIGMSTTIDLEGKLEGGLLGGITRMFSGENFFFQTLRANRGPGNVLLAQSMPGDVVILDLDGTVEYNVQKNGFLAGEEGITVSTKAQNIAQGFFSGEGFFILKIGGRGKLVISSFGAIHEVSLAPGEDYVVDNNHLVAWPTTTPYTIDKASKGWISSFTSGEGLVCKFRGPGKIYIQTRNTQAFGSWVRKLIPVQSSSSSTGLDVAGGVMDLLN